MKAHRTGIGTAIMGVIAIVLLIVVGAAAYYVGASTAPGGATSTVTQTVSGGGGAATTATTTVTVGAGATATVTSTQTQTVTTGGGGGGGGGTSGNATQSLIDACKAEGGTVTYYSTTPADVWAKQTPYLTAAFPWLKVNYNPFPGAGALYTKALAEFQSGHTLADVFTVSRPTQERLIAAGAIQPYDSYASAMENFSSSFQDPRNFFEPNYNLALVVTYNKNLVKDPSTLPKSWTDLNNSIWKGKLALNNPTTLSASALVFATLFGQMGNASATKFLQSIKANNPIFVSDSGATYQAVATGQAAIGLQLLDDYVNGNQSQVGLDVINPIYTSLVVETIAKGAAHPHCGELISDWSTSYLGQYSVSITGRVPILAPLQQAFLKPYTGGTNVQVLQGAYNQPTIYTNPSVWAAYFTSIFG